MLKPATMAAVTAVAAVLLAGIWLLVLWGAWADGILAIRLTITLLVVWGVYLICYLVYREVADEKRQRRDGFLD
ncbi:MAG: hypothetical protein AAF899_14525 [Pseudomonadota bacterium]